MRNPFLPSNSPAQLILILSSGPSLFSAISLLLDDVSSHSRVE
jgi:hypothetical protein